MWFCRESVRDSIQIAFESDGAGSFGKNVGIRLGDEKESIGRKSGMLRICFVRTSTEQSRRISLLFAEAVPEKSRTYFYSEYISSV